MPLEFRSPVRVPLDRTSIESDTPEAVRRFAGGVAHDFNNLLTLIVGHVDVLLEGLSEDHPSRARAAGIRNAAEAAAGITGNLLAVSERQVLVPSIVNLNHTIDALVTRLRVSFPVAVRLRLDLEPRVALVDVDPDQIARAFVSLLSAARDAVQGGGTVSVITRTEMIDSQPMIRVRITCVGDAGKPEPRDGVFEPFASDTVIGRDSSLSVAGARGVIRQSRGGIVVERVPGQGEAIVISLPTARQAH